MCRARGAVVVGVVHGGHHHAGRSQVVQAAIDGHVVQPHRQVHRSFARDGEEARVMVGGFGHRGGAVAMRGGVPREQLLALDRVVKAQPLLENDFSC